MSKPEVNVLVGGPKVPTNYTYKTVVLKSNLPFAAQIGDPNCIYVIKWDFDLNGETVEIPENCVLKFDGGSLKNGIVVGNNTSIDAVPVKIFSTDISLEGTWNVTETYSEWFGAKGDGRTDCTDAIDRCLQFIGHNNGGTLLLLSGKYVADGIVTSIKTSIKGQGMGSSIIHITGKGHGIEIPNQSRALKLEDFTIVGDGNEREDVGNGIHIYRTNGGGEGHDYVTNITPINTTLNPSFDWIVVRNIAVYYFTDGLFCGNRNYFNIVENCIFAYCNGNGINYENTDSEIASCYTFATKLCGMLVRGSNNRIHDIKVCYSNYNTAHNPDTYQLVAGGYHQPPVVGLAGVYVTGKRNILSNIETQESFCSGFKVFNEDAYPVPNEYTGEKPGFNSGNIFVNCLSNGDGQAGVRDAIEYNPEYNNYGFHFQCPVNASNCLVATMGNARVESPVFIKSPVCYEGLSDYLENMDLSEIQIADMYIPMYRDAIHMKDYLLPKGINDLELGINQADNYKYFSEGTFTLPIDLQHFLSIIYLQIKVKSLSDIVFENNYRVLSFYNGDTLKFSLVANIQDAETGSYLYLSLYDNTTNLTISKVRLGNVDVVEGKEVVAVFYPNEITDDNGDICTKWTGVSTSVKKEENTNQPYYIFDFNSRYQFDGDSLKGIESCVVNEDDCSGILINKVIITNERIFKSQIIAGYDTKHLYADALLYLSADSFIPHMQSTDDLQTNDNDV